MLEPFLGPSEFDNHGQRVVEGQRLTQAANDIMLGWLRTAGPDGRERDYYVRQLWDAKGSALVELMNPKALAEYARVCGQALARAHARSGDAVPIASYLGRGDRFDRALAAFAEAYADQNEQRLRGHARGGRRRDDRRADRRLTATLPEQDFGSRNPRTESRIDMSEKPVFIYAATYSNPADAEADYEGLLELHAAKLVGTYDVALVTKDDEGKVHVRKHEKPTQHGAWGGIAVGAAIGVLAAPAVVPAALVGGVIGGLGGHFRKGIARGDAKELGDLIDAGEATLLVIGESRLEEQLEKALTRAEKAIEKEIEVDREEFKRELERAEKEYADAS